MTSSERSESEQRPCAICEASAETLGREDLGNDIHWKCKRCGEYRLLGSARGFIPRHGAAGRAKISGWIFDRNKDREVPVISRDILEKILARPLPTIAERADRLLLEALRGQERLGDQFYIVDPRFVAATYSQDVREVDFLFRLLSERGLAKAVAMGGRCEVQPSGYIAADELTRGASRSDKGFIAMWFDPELESAYEQGFQIGVMNAGYDPIRMDRVEHANRIDDEIIARIRTASFVVADFTGHRGGVYFEAGFALGLDLPVIWTCKKDHMENLHLDIRQYNTIDWECPDELALRLQRRIEATIGKGPKAILDS